ncbi:preprotein translocase subunit SecY [Mycoplasmatota bacterium]|nr:preprotein translocase subunit SecY [Mycoplasmatota bacterium]
MKTLKLVLKNKQLLNKILFTLGAFALYRIAVFITLPMISIPDELFNNDLLGFLNSFSGGALKNFSVIALGVGPYITASIVVQILQMDIVPIIKEWSEEGDAGKQKINQLTRYLAIGLAFVQALAMTIGLSSYLDLGVATTPLVFVYLALLVTAGTAFLLWLGDQITVKGVGNGVSMIIAAGIISSMPGMYRSLWLQYVAIDAANWRTYLQFGIVILLMITVLLGVIFMQAVVRKVPVQYANRQGQAKLRGRSESNIPIKLNSAGVIPVIFAITILSLPLTVISYLNVDAKWTNILTQIFSNKMPIGFVLYIAFIFIFTFFYAFMQVNPEKISDNLSRQNAFVPSRRPGADTEVYLSKVLFKVTLLGALYLTIVAIIPILSAAAFNLPSSVSVGGTSLLIVVGVAVETFKQIQTEANKQEYRGFSK